MKKMKVVLGSLLIIVVCTGCFNKTLTCSLEEDSQKALVVVKYDSSGEEIKTIKSSFEIDMDGILDEEEIEEYSNTFCYEMIGDETKGVNCDVGVNGMIVEMEINIDMSEASDEVLESLEFGNIGAYDEAKEASEADGYTCK